jgi:hypothetical protein
VTLFPWRIALAIATLAGLVLLGVVVSAQAPLMLVFGWALFLWRTLPRMTADWPSVGVGTAAFVLLTVGVHVAGRAWAGQGWKLRWSVAGTLLVVVLFASGVALVASIHQVAWLVTSKEPLLVPTGPNRGHFSHRNDLQSLGMAFGDYAASLGNGHLPPGGTFAPDGTMLHSWETHLLLHIPYAVRIDMKQPWNSPANEHHFRSVVPEFINPALENAPFRDANGFGLSHLAANVNVMYANGSLALRDLPNGNSNTILVGEVNANFQPWGHPVNWRDPERGINRSPYGFGGAPDAGGANFIMGDGSVRFVSERVSPEVLRALGSAREDRPR